MYVACECRRVARPRHPKLGIDGYPDLPNWAQQRHPRLALKHSPEAPRQALALAGKTKRLRVLLRLRRRKQEFRRGTA